MRAFAEYDPMPSMALMAPPETTAVIRSRTDTA